MSLSRPVRRQTARVSGKKSKILKSSSPQAPASEDARNTPRSISPVYSKSALPDSGFFESADNYLFQPADAELPSHGFSNDDWVLFGDENIAKDPGYYFQDDDATDIASVKANHGSRYNGANNEDDTLVSARFPSSSRRSQPLSVIYESPRRNDPPHHAFTHHPTTQPGASTLQTWLQTPEQHEILAYRLEQPRNASHVFHSPQYSWDADIDLSPYEVRA